MPEIRESDYMDYLTWDASKWRCWREGKDRFFHAPEGDRSGGRRDGIINYITWDGGHWTAKWNRNDFIHYPKDNPGQQHSDKVLNYFGWAKAGLTNERWQAYWDAKKGLFVHTRIAPG